MGSLKNKLKTFAAGAASVAALGAATMADYVSGENEQKPLDPAPEKVLSVTGKTVDQKTASQKVSSEKSATASASQSELKKNLKRQQTTLEGRSVVLAGHSVWLPVAGESPRDYEKRVAQLNEIRVSHMLAMKDRLGYRHASPSEAERQIRADMPRSAVELWQKNPTAYTEVLEENFANSIVDQGLDLATLSEDKLINLVRQDPFFQLRETLKKERSNQALSAKLNSNAR